MGQVSSPCSEMGTWRLFFTPSLLGLGRASPLWSSLGSLVWLLCLCPRGLGWGPPSSSSGELNGCHSHLALILEMLDQDRSSVSVLIRPLPVYILSQALILTSCFPRLQWVLSPDPVFILVALTAVEAELPPHPRGGLGGQTTMGQLPVIPGKT